MMDDATREMRGEAIASHMKAFGVSAEVAAREIDLLAEFLRAESKAPVTYTNRAARREQAKRERKRNAH